MTESSVPANRAFPSLNLSGGLPNSGELVDISRGGARVTLNRRLTSEDVVRVPEHSGRGGEFDRLVLLAPTSFCPSPPPGCSVSLTLVDWSQARSVLQISRNRSGPGGAHEERVQTAQASDHRRLATVNPSRRVPVLVLKGRQSATAVLPESRRGGMADAEDLKSSGRERPCGFKSHRRY